MEPPDEYQDLHDVSMNEHYSKEHAWEQKIREKQKRDRARVTAVVGGPFDVDDYMKRHGHEQMYGRKKMLHTKQENFDMVWPLVHTICESLMYEPEKWEFYEHRFKHRDNEVEFWCHQMNSPVTETFNMGPGATQTVFNHQQGEAILEAAKIARRTAPSDLQRLLIAKFGLNSAPVVDERHVINIPKMTFWRRLIFLFTARCEIN